MAMIGQAGGEKIKPVLLLHDSAGFSFALSMDGSMRLQDVNAPIPLHPPQNNLLVLASLDAAATFSMRLPDGDTWSHTQVLVIADSWIGHDHALRNFTLLFVRHRLLAAGLGAVTFLVTDGEIPPEGWHRDLAVIQAPLPLPSLARATTDKDLPPSLCLLLDAASDSRDILEWVERLRRDRGIVIRAIADPEGLSDIQVPARVHLIDQPDRVWNWLAPRIHVMAKCGSAGWHRRYETLGRQSGIPSVDVATVEGRVKAQNLLEQRGRSAIPQPEQPLLANWFSGLVATGGAV
jgi:hypothetical protein